MDHQVGVLQSNFVHHKLRHWSYNVTVAESTGWSTGWYRCHIWVMCQSISLQLLTKASSWASSLAPFHQHQWGLVSCFHKPQKWGLYCSSACLGRIILKMPGYKRKFDKYRDGVMSEEWTESSVVNKMFGTVTNTVWPMSQDPSY